MSDSVSCWRAIGSDDHRRSPAVSLQVFYQRVDELRLFVLWLRSSGCDTEPRRDHPQIVLDLAGTNWETMLGFATGDRHPRLDHVEAIHLAVRCDLLSPWRCDGRGVRMLLG